MADFVELSMDELEKVTGGAIATVNTGTPEKAAIRESPGNGHIITSLLNGTQVDTVGDLFYDAGTGRNWIKVRFKYKGKITTGWIAASIVGLKR